MEDLEDDTHICLKCNMKILGLENYVKHRKENECFPNKRKRRNSSVEATMFMESLGLQDITAKKSKPEKDNLNWSGDVDENALLSSMVEEESNKIAKPQGGSRNFSLLSFLKHSSHRHDQRHSGDDQEFQFQSFAFSPNQNDFMRQMNLMNVSKIGVESSLETTNNKSEGEEEESGEEILNHTGELNVLSPPLSTTTTSAVNTASSNPKWRLWQPEQENDELWNDVLSQSEIYFDINQPSGSGVTDKEIGFESPLACSGKLPVEISPGTDNNEQDVSPSKDSPKETTILFPPPNLPEKRVRVKKLFADLDDNDKIRNDKKKTPLPHEIITCPTCNYQAYSSQFGKHLISHYHLNHSKVPRNHPKLNQLVFENIDDIVKLAPFRCDICHYFYCNWPQEFRNHWEAKHRTDSCSNEDRFWCSFCSFLTDSGESMLGHLSSNKHLDIISAIGRVVPIIIRKIDLFECDVCDRKFRLRFSLSKHMNLLHRDSSFQLEDHQRLQCEHCSFFSYSDKSLSSHTFLVHPEKRSKYKCNICRLSFDSKKEVEKHRKSLVHRTKLKSMHDESEWEVKCEFCLKRSSNLIHLKEHIVTEHQDLMSQCGICGDSFPIRQDLASHVKGRCQSTKGIRIEGDMKCEKRDCDFSCKSLNMLLFHQALRHNENENNQGVFQCHVCDKEFSKSKLWDHIRIHGDSHRCQFCYKIFDSRSSVSKHLSKFHSEEISGKLWPCEICPFSSEKKSLLNLHMKRTHFQIVQCTKCDTQLKSYHSYVKHMQLHTNGLKLKFKCENCSFVGSSKTALQSHSTTHLDPKRIVTEKCQFCAFECKRKSELNRHVKNSHEENNKKNRFECSNCDYFSFSRQHLKRHYLLKHDEDEKGQQISKSFHCRFCDYNSKEMDNLRKHILKTGKHPNKFVYHCEFCEFVSNPLQEFKSHLLLSHSERFVDRVSLLDYVRNYFKIKH